MLRLLFSAVLVLLATVPVGSLSETRRHLRAKQAASGGEGSSGGEVEKAVETEAVPASGGEGSSGGRVEKELEAEVVETGAGATSGDEERGSDEGEKEAGEGSGSEEADASGSASEGESEEEEDKDADAADGEAGGHGEGAEESEREGGEDAGKEDSEDADDDDDDEEDDAAEASNATNSSNHSHTTRAPARGTQAQKAQLEKAVNDAHNAVIANLKRQVDLHMEIKDLDDEIKSRKQIADSEVAVAAETQSKAVAGFLGDMWSEMRAFSKPFYKEHLEEELEKVEEQAPMLQAVFNESRANLTAWRPRIYPAKSNVA